MSAAETLDLPGVPPPSLRASWESLDPATRHALLGHLLGRTSAEWLALILTEHGHRIGATTIRNYQRSLTRE